MIGTTGTSAFSDLTRLAAVAMLLCLIGTGCGAKRDDQAGTVTDAPPAVPTPDTPLPPSTVDAANAKFNGLTSGLSNCGASLQQPDPLMYYLKGLFNQFMGGGGTTFGSGFGFGTMGDPNSGTAWGKYFMPPNDGRDRGVMGDSAGMGCLGNLGASMYQLAGLAGNGYGAGGINNYIGSCVSWIFRLLHGGAYGGGYGSGYGNGYGSGYGSSWNNGY